MIVLNSTLRDIAFAEARIRKYIRETPLYKSEIYSEETSSSIFLKLENFQVTGSFKIRGVLNKFLKDETNEAKRFITVSMGNHAIAVAYASKLLNIETLIVVPKNITWLKKQRITSLGGKILIHGENFDEAEKYARELAEKDDYIFLSPYNDSDMIEGAATIGLEVLKKAPDVEVFLVPIGGGGLISGIANYAKIFSRDIEIIGVQSNASPAMYLSFKKGKIVKAKLKPSIAEGLHGNIEEGAITFDFVKKYVDDVVLVEEDEIRDSMKLLYLKEGIIVEGASAVTLAALYKYQERFKGKNVCLILSGGNIDPEVFYSVLMK